MMNLFRALSSKQTMMRISSGRKEEKQRKKQTM